MRLRPVYSLTLTLLAATCSGDPAAFYNPTSGAIAQCQVSDLDPFGDQCMATYEKAGWEKLTGPVSHRDTPPRVVPE